MTSTQDEQQPLFVAGQRVRITVGTLDDMTTFGRHEVDAVLDMDLSGNPLAASPGDVGTIENVEEDTVYGQIPFVRFPGTGRGVSVLAENLEPA